MILVTGGTGFVGTKVVHALRAEERDVAGVLKSAAANAETTASPAPDASSASSGME